MVQVDNEVVVEKDCVGYVGREEEIIGQSLVTS